MKLGQIKEQYAALKLAGKQAIVVGGTSGIGEGIALRLAEAEANVIIVGRNEKKATEIINGFKERNPSSKGVFEFMRCDAQLLKNVKTFAKEFGENHENLDYLVLTQGIATTQGYTPTEEGLDQKLSVHYFSRMAFIECMLPFLRNSEDPRVLSVLSAGVHSPYKNYQNDFDLKKTYSIKNAADAAGLYNDIGLDSFARENPKITFIHSCPGFVNTNWGTEMPALIRWGIRPLQAAFGKSAADCAHFMTEPLFKQNLEKNFYLKTDLAGDANVTALHEEAREVVWKNTKEILDQIWSNNAIEK